MLTFLSMKGKKSKNLKKRKRKKKKINRKKKKKEKKKKKKKKKKKRGKEEKKKKKIKKKEKKKKKNKKKKKKDGKAKKDKKEVKELWEWRDKLKKEEEKEKNNIKKNLYPGIRRYVWSENRDELIIEYRGDLFRYICSDDKISRLTKTDQKEKIVSYTKDSNGYVYRVSNSIFRVFFNSSIVLQVNPKLIGDKNKKFDIKDASVSPDGNWVMALGVEKKKKKIKKNIKILTYKDRFAKIKKIREFRHKMPEEKRDEPVYRFYLQKINQKKQDKQRKPVFFTPGGDIFYEFGYGILDQDLQDNFKWSKDSSKYLFSTWEREKGVMKIWVGRTGYDFEPEMIYEIKTKLDHDEFYNMNAEFSPDGKCVIAVYYNKDGYRHPFKINISTKKSTDMIKGKFEAFPVLGFSKDNKSFFVTADYQNPSMRTVYRVSLADREMVIVGKKNGMHRNSKLSHNAKFIASMYGNWSSPPELFFLNMENNFENVLTESHSDDWVKYNILKPELFSFKNRHKDSILCTVFKPENWKKTDNRPAIIYVYGGALGRRHLVEKDDFSGSSYLFPLYMAIKHGYVMVVIDSRGMSGYGEKFATANLDKPGVPQVEDLQDLLKYMGENLGVNTAKVGLHGWSFGGFQTQMALYTSPGTFACGIAGAGPTEWENYNYWYTGITISKLVRNKVTLRKFSLLPLAKNLRDPLLLVHGMEDSNVLFQDTVHVYSELLKSGKETLVELFLDPAGGHGLRGFVKSKGKYKKFEQFFLRHLGEYEEEK